jgi:hypothetical protein
MKPQLVNKPDEREEEGAVRRQPGIEVDVVSAPKRIFQGLAIGHNPFRDEERLSPRDAGAPGLHEISLPDRFGRSGYCLLIGIYHVKPPPLLGQGTVPAGPVAHPGDKDHKRRSPMADSAPLAEPAPRLAMTAFR